MRRRRKRDLQVSISLPPPTSGSRYTTQPRPRDMYYRVRMCVRVCVSTFVTSMLYICLYVDRSLSHPPPPDSHSNQVLFKDGHQVALEVDVNGVCHLRRRGGHSVTGQEQLLFFYTLILSRLPPLACVSPARGVAPSPAAGPERSGKPTAQGAGLAAVGAGPAESAWAAWRPEVWARAATVALGDGERLLGPAELVPACPRRRDLERTRRRLIRARRRRRHFADVLPTPTVVSPALSWPVPLVLSAASPSPPSPERRV